MRMWLNYEFLGIKESLKPGFERSVNNISPKAAKFRIGRLPLTIIVNKSEGFCILWLSTMEIKSKLINYIKSENSRNV